MGKARVDFLTLLAATALGAGLVVVAGGPAPAWAACRSLPFATLVSLPFAFAARAAGVVSPSGAVAGLLISSTLLAGAGWPAWLQLGVVLIVTAGATGAGRARNLRTGLLDDPRGRGWRNVAANTGLAACAAVAARNPAVRDQAAVVVASVLVAGAGDTVASEIGKAFGGLTAITFTGLRRVPAGTPGAVSPIGTLSGIASATAMAVCAHLVGLVRLHEVWIVATAGALAILADSAIADLLEAGGWIDNDGVNLLATWTAAAAAVGLCALGLDS